MARDEHPQWKYLNREQRIIEIGWAVWVVLVFLGVPVAWLISWLVSR